MSEMDQALAHHQAGRFDQAETLCRQILAAEPTHADALHLLGVLRAQNGQPEEGLSLIERAIAANPHAAEYHNNRGQVLYVLGRLEAAIQAYRQGVALGSAEPQVHRNLGNALVETGRPEEAVPVYRRAIMLTPDSSELHNNLAMALQAQGRLDEAITYFTRALALEPESANINYNLGNALQHDVRLAEAAAAYRRALALKPNFAEAHNNLGATLAQQEGVVAAIACYEQAVALRPDYVEAYNNLGSALRKAGRATEAIATLQHALALNPRNADVYHNLAFALRTRGQVTESIATYHQALALEPKAETHSNLLFCMHYDLTSTPEALFAEASRWQKRYVLPLIASLAPHANARDPNRRLRVGYFSPDFRSHSVAYFTEALLAHHDREKIEVFCYANLKRPDAITERLRGLADNWRDIVRLSNEQATQRIRQDQIDILVDLAGHTAGNRLLVLARKPAPVQLTYLGYPDTTGLDAVDYRLTDALADPPGKTEAFHSEELVRLPQGFLCYQPSAESPSVGSLPAPSAGHVTFASFNDATKVNEEVVRCWARILDAVPDSHLMLKARAFADEGTRERFISLFIAHGVRRARLELVGWIFSTAEHLRHYHRVDMALDPFPYNGTTTTCEALWMGVPVIALAGRRHAGRVGVSLLTHVGLPELIAKTPEQYIALAVELASDLERLKALRQTLREQLQRSSLMDAEGFTRSLEAAYRRMWENYCKASGN